MNLPLPKTDNQHTLWMLIHNSSVTSIDLRKTTKSSYPPARIKNLKDYGLSIISTREKYVNRRGETSSISRYMLATPKKQAIEVYKKMAV